MSNRLANEPSPYLRQHADNPVDWYPWGEEALDRARREDRPILLSVGYSACHWCHVMAHESFEDEGVAQLMNERFVNVKVDREERPELDQLYQGVVQLMGGQLLVESEGGKGSTFHFTAWFELSPGPAERLIPPELTQLHGLPVLVVDDNATNRRILEELLGNWGMRPTAVDGGPAALAALAKAHQAVAPFALILLDAQMPGMDGFTLAGDIRQHPEVSGTMSLVSAISRIGWSAGFTLR